MADYYAVSGVLVKRHVNEVGSVWFRMIADPATVNAIITSGASIIEVNTAFNPPAREAGVSKLAYTQIAADFASICGVKYQIVELTILVAGRVRVLLERHALRAYVAIQLASALVTSEALQTTSLSALTFLAPGGRLLIAAQAEGLAIDNPSTYPLSQRLFRKLKSLVARSVGMIFNRSAMKCLQSKQFWPYN